MSGYSGGRRNSFDSGEIEFVVQKRLGILANYDTGWTKEVNIISWNKGPFKIDIRDWDPEHEHMSKGITLHEEEAQRLLRVLKTQFETARDGSTVKGRGWDTAKKAKDFDELEKQAQLEREERMTESMLQKQAEDNDGADIVTEETPTKLQESDLNSEQESEQEMISDEDKREEF